MIDKTMNSIAIRRNVTDDLYQKLISTIPNSLNFPSEKPVNYHNQRFLAKMLTKNFGLAVFYQIASKFLKSVHPFFGVKFNLNSHIHTYILQF